MKLEVWKQWEIRDKDGKLIKRTRVKKCHSYVRAMADLLCGMMGEDAAPAATAVDTGNTSRTVGNQEVGANGEILGVESAAASNTYGLVVGTGTNAVALSDYGLQTIIAHGTGAGQLEYGAMSHTAPVTSGTTRRFTLIRSFTNNSGASITVNETGLYVICQFSAGTWYFCIERALESPGQAIANTTTATLTYTMGVTV